MSTEYLPAAVTAKGLIHTDPAQGMDIGADGQTAVGEYQSPLPFAGAIDEVRLYFEAATAERIAKRFQDGSEISSDAVLAVSFDDGTARDHGIHRNNGTIEGAKVVDGKFGKAHTIRRPQPEREEEGWE